MKTEFLENSNIFFPIFMICVSNYVKYKITSIK